MELLSECSWLPQGEKAQKRPLGYRIGGEDRVSSEETLGESEEYHEKEPKLDVALSIALASHLNS